MTYLIVRATKPQDLVDEINKLIGEGYTPLGGIAIRSSTEYSEQLYVQALIKE